MRQLDPKAVWLFFTRAILMGIPVIFFIAIWVLTITGGLDTKSSEFEILKIVLLLPWFVSTVVILLALLYIWSLLSYKYYRFELREDGFRKESGVIYKRYVSIPYERIQNVDILRGIMARLLGLSDLYIQTAGMSGAQPYNVLAEGRLPGLHKEEAERIRDDLIARARQSKKQGL